MLKELMVLVLIIIGCALLIKGIGAGVLGIAVIGIGGFLLLRSSKRSGL